MTKEKNGLNGVEEYNGWIFENLMVSCVHNYIAIRGPARNEHGLTIKLACVCNQRSVATDNT